MKRTIVIIAFLIWLILTLISGEAYLGSLPTFITFPVAAALMGATAWLGPKSYFYQYFLDAGLLDESMHSCDLQS